MYFLVGVAFTLSTIKDLFMVVGAFAYSWGVSYLALLISGGVGMVAVAALLARLIVYLAYRLNGAIFTRKSGMLYPFPISYRDFESTVLAFTLPCFLLSGIVVFPAFFLPTVALVLDAIVPLIRYAFLAVTFSYFLKYYAHDYDKRSLAFSLSIVPLIIIGFTLILAIVGVLL